MEYLSILSLIHLTTLIRKFHQAKKNNKEEVVVWRTGTPQPEFMHVEDMPDASLF